MKCPVCFNSLKPLFTSMYCPWCEDRTKERAKLEANRAKLEIKWAALFPPFDPLSNDDEETKP